jgi:hypothetical protein
LGEWYDKAEKGFAQQVPVPPVFHIVSFRMHSILCAFHSVCNAGNNDFLGRLFVRVSRNNAPNRIKNALWLLAYGNNGFLHGDVFDQHFE